MSHRPKIVVVGSSNTDMVVKTERIPSPGETVIGGDFVIAAGGKGANQAVAAARLGADVTLVARLGSDLFGDQSLENFKQEGINTDFIVRDAAAPSGVALISVDSRGENSIVVAPGSNGRLSVEDVDKAADEIRKADALVMQLESPMETVTHAARIAHEAGVRVILTPAPAQHVPKETLALIDVLIPNEYEAAQLAAIGSHDVEDLGRALLEAGVGTVIITLGSKGVMMVQPGGTSRFEARKVEAVDTTAAGDSFTGALACALAEGKDMPDAITFAISAAAITVTRMGAQPSLPTRAELEGSLA